MSHSLSNRPVAFHLSMNVSDIDRSVAFFTKVFGTPPSKHRDDYAKFELQNPPITFSLEPVSPAERGALNHVGFKLQSPEDLVELQRRLEMAGIRSEREEGVECCYSKQTKFWLHDPDGTLWELYVLEGDIEHRGSGQSAQAVQGDQAASSSKPAPLVCSMSRETAGTEKWSHRLGMPLAVPKEILPESLDEAALQGTFNGEETLPRIGPFLKEVADRLRAGGRISIHCLTADRHVEQLPTLPGPASVVGSVPCLNRLIDHLEEAGFQSIRLTKYGSRACFTAGEAELRETMIEAFKPNEPSRDDLVAIIYKGPFPVLKIDDGPTISRGRRTEIPRRVAEFLKSTPAGDDFVVLETATSPVACTG